MKIAIDIVSDVVCPWCLIGLTRLEQALEKTGDVGAELVFHPFLLQPTTPREGVDLGEWLTRKYGVSPDRMYGPVESAARESGIPLDFTNVPLMVNTISAHVLLRHARGRGTQHSLKRALLTAYFLDGKDVGDSSVLAHLASEHGFTADEVLALVDDESERAQTKDEASAMSAQGINGVPFFIFDGRLALSGAQPVEMMQRAIERALEPSEQAETT